MLALAGLDALCVYVCVHVSPFALTFPLMSLVVMKITGNNGLMIVLSVEQSLRPCRCPFNGLV